MTQKTAEQVKSDALASMQEYFPNGGRDWDNVSALFDAIRDGKVVGLGAISEKDQLTPLDPPRAEMVEYIKTAIGEGYQPGHEAAVTDLNVIDGLGDHSLNREFGMCWQWYNMGGGFHETFDKNKTHDHACVNCFTDKGPCLSECNITDSNKKLASFEEASKPLIKWLAENVHPHHTVIVTSTGAELMVGEMSFPTEEFLKD